MAFGAKVRKPFHIWLAEAQRPHLAFEDGVDMERLTAEHGDLHRAVVGLELLEELGKED